MRKIILGVVGISVVAVAGVWGAAAYFLDSQTIAQQLKVEIAKRFNRELVFNGQLQTQFFPKVQIVLPPTTLSYAGKADPQFSLTAASIGVELLPLIRGDVQFDAVNIKGLKGTVNAKRFTQKVDKQKGMPESSKKVSSEASESSFIKNLKVDSVSIEDCALTVYGLQDQKVYRVSQLNLQTGEIGLSGTTPVKFSTTFEEKTQAVSGQLVLETTATYDLNSLDVTLDNFQTKVSVNQKDKPIQFALKTPQIAYLKRDVSVKLPALTVELGEEDNVNVSADQFNTLNNMAAWELTNSKVLAQQGKELRVEAKGNFEGVFESLSVLSTDFGATIDTLINGVKTQIPLSGRVSGSVASEKASIMLNGKLDSQAWFVNLMVDGFDKPMIRGDAELVAITLDKWLTQAQSVAFSNGLAPVSQAFADSIERISVLDNFNVDLGVKVGEVRYKQLPISAISAKVQLKNALLSLKDVKANLCDGHVDAKVTLDANQKWSVNQSATKVNIAKLLKGLQLPEVLAGSGQMSANLSGIGLDEIAMKKTATGTVQMRLNEAVLQGLSLEKVAKSVREKELSGLIMTQDDQTKFSVFSALMTVGDGKLRIKELKGESSVASVNGQLNVGLIDSAMIGNVSAVLATSADGRRVTVPIAIGGTLTSPAYNIDVASAIKENLSEKVKAKGREKLEEGIGKLLNRLNR